jgi:hypothetical protein
MLRLTNLEGSRRKSCCAFVVFLAVTSLALSVATRYCSPQNSSYSARTLHKHSSPEQARQRLTNTAVNWMPEVVQSGVLLAPSSYPRIAPAGPPIPNVQFETSLYNRPPPSC